MLFFGDKGMDGLRLALVCCPLCGDHGVVILYHRGGPKVMHSIWTQGEARLLHDRLLADGGDFQFGFMGELEGAEYLAEDIYPQNVVVDAGLLATLGITPACQMEVFALIH